LLERQPAFCRVAATLKPTSVSDIQIEVLLPAANRNAKFHAIGNAVWAGRISTSAMIEPPLDREKSRSV
jgi:feruloyl esterase